jgi:hypothetical protein
MMTRRVLCILIITQTLLIMGLAWYTFSTRNQMPAQIFPATINRDCAPWDGSAFRVSILTNDGTAVNISIYQSPEINHPSTFSFPDETGQTGNAFILRKSGLSEQLSGNVSFQNIAEESQVEGELDLMTHVGNTFKGKFIAEWGNEVVYCG